jgi:large subunit ribosomal protein L30
MENDMKETVTYTQVKSGIGSPESIRATLVGLGLTKMYKTVTKRNTPELRGMLYKVQHLVKMEG